jgi:hypothetical protein
MLQPPRPRRGSPRATSTKPAAATATSPAAGRPHCAKATTTSNSNCSIGCSGDEPADKTRKFDNSIAFRLLTAHRESAAQHRAVRDNEDADAIIASINAKLDLMRERTIAAGEYTEGEE